MLPIVARVFTVVLFHILTVAGEKCIDGKYHMNTSAPATGDYAQCQSWNNKTCCTANFTIELHKHRVRNLYDLHWGHCKNISTECEKYLLAEECFYQCEPRLIEWHTGKGSLKGVPVCSDYCNEWFKACENDQTCVESWFDFTETEDINMRCPNDSVCRTFKQTYGNGQNLCNKMWGDTFVYVDRSCPCTRLDKPVPEDVSKMSTCSASVSPSQFFAFPLLLGSLAIAGIKYPIKITP